MEGGRALDQLGQPQEDKDLTQSGVLLEEDEDLQHLPEDNLHLREQIQEALQTEEVDRLEGHPTQPQSKNALRDWDIARDHGANA